MQGPFERVVHCSGQNSSLAPGTAVTGTRGPITCFLRKPIPVPPPAAKAHCTAHRQASASVCHQSSHSGARRQARHLLSRPPQQTCKLTAKLHRTSATTHPSCHTPLSPFCSVAAKPPTTTVTATTPLLSHPMRTCLTLIGLQSSFHGQTSQIPSDLSPKRDYSVKRVKSVEAKLLCNHCYHTH